MPICHAVAMICVDYRAASWGMADCGSLLMTLITDKEMVVASACVHCMRFMGLCCWKHLVKGMWDVYGQCCCRRAAACVDRITALESAATASEWLLLVGLGCQGECL